MGEAPTATLRAERLGKVFAEARGDPTRSLVALEDVDLEIGAGEFVSIVGPSGCGKSTLLDMLAGLTLPSSGWVVLGGRRRDDLLGRVGYMQQDDLLMPWRTVLDNTTIGLELNGVPRRQARRRALAEFPRFGLEGFERHWPATLSGGMRQRAALLRTFLAGREVMLLDEPFGALDALTRARMQQWLLGIWSADRKTILFVTHDVEEAVFLADRAYVMSGRPGRIALSLDIDLPRPRGRELTVEPEFLELKRRLLEPLADEMTAAGER